MIERNVVLLYFIEQNGQWFKSYVRFDPYFFIKCDKLIQDDMKNYLEKKYEKELASVSIENKINLDNIAHMEGIKDQYIKLRYNIIHLKFRILL